MMYAGLTALVTGADLLLKQRVEAQKEGDFPRPLAGTKDRIWVYRNHNAGFPFGFMEENEEL